MSARTEAWPETLRRRGAAADRLLHRHERLHRLQGLRGGVQGVEPRSRGRPRLQRRVVRQHLELGANSWRHVAFVEQTTPLRMEGDGGGAEGEDPLRWLMSSDVCKHCTDAGLPRRLPDRRAVPDGARNRGRPGGRVQRLRLLRPGVPVRRPRPARAAGTDRGGRATGGSGSARSATTAPRGGSRRPAPRPARPSRSSSARWTSCASAPPSRLDKVVADGFAGAQLYGDDPGDGVGGFGAFFLLLDEPEVYGLPPAPVATRPATWARCGGARPRPGPRSSPGSASRSWPGGTEWARERSLPTTAGRSSSRRSGSARSAGTSSPAGWPGRRRRWRSCARASGNPVLARRAALVAPAAVNASPALLMEDLGRPERFLNMMRVFKPSSPMSVGSWLLARLGRDDERRRAASTSQASRRGRGCG